MNAEHVDTSQTLERYVAILDVFAGLRRSTEAGGDHAVDANGVYNGRAYGVADVSRALGLSKGTISRYLHRLEQAGVLVRLPDRRYALATRVYHWGHAAAPRPDLRIQARPVMDELSARFGETVSLYVLDADSAVCIDKIDGLHPIRLSGVVGRRRPLHVGASPRMMLAFASSERQEAFLATAPFPAMTPRTMTDAETLRQSFAETRRMGYVISVGESNEGAVGISAPLRDATREVCGAITIAGPENRFREERREEIVRELLVAVERVSRSLGYLPGASPPLPITGVEEVSGER